MAAKNQFIQDCHSFKINTDGIGFETNQGIKGQLTFVNSNVIQVNYSKEDLDHFSYAVKHRQSVAIDVVNKTETIALSSAQIRISFSKKNACLTIFNHQNQIVCEDGLPVNWIGTEVICCKKLQQDEKFIGLGEKTGNLNRRGTAYTNWNTDKFAYDIEQDPLYLSTPFYIGVHNGLCYGIFMDNSHRTNFNFGASTNRFCWFSAEDGPMNYYFIYGESIPEIIQHYSQLTGCMELPPLWSLGFQQCRYSYYPDAEMYQLAQTFRAKQIPCDVLYLDIHYMQDYKAFTFDKNRFPNPQKMVEDLKNEGFKTAVILDPGIKTEAGYYPYESGIENDVFVNYPDGIPYTGEVWPGESHFPDFTHPEVRKWWADLMPFYTNLGIKGFWNDMNEPAAWGQCLPNMLEFEYEGEQATHRKARNVYGMQMTRATKQGLNNSMQEERPFVLTRAGYCGIQRYAAVWTGDNVASDEHLMLGVRLVNSLGLTGVPFCGNDVGGFVGEASPALYARWISVGAFQPFFRAHSMVNSRDAEPWSFGEEVEQIARNYIGLRYKLMPYIYNLFWEAAQTGIPVNRSMAIYHPHEESTYDVRFQHQFYMGRDLLIVPSESTADYVETYLPEGNWYRLWDDHKIAGDSYPVEACPTWKLPVFVRGGAILMLQNLQQNLDRVSDNIELHLYGPAAQEIVWYQDDGISTKHKDGVSAQRTLKKSSSNLIIGASHGTYNSSIKRIRVYLHDIKFERISLNGKALQVQRENYRFVDPIQSIDTFSTQKGSDMQIVDLSYVEFGYSANKIELSWT